MASLEDHYDALRSRDGYESVDDLSLGGLDPAGVARRFVFGEDAHAFAETPIDDVVCTFGVSVTGPPHVGTLGQMQTAIALQNAGFDVQFIVADFEPYSTDGYALDVVRERARRFVEFVETLGFDPEQGRLRTQYGAEDVTHTAYHLSRYAKPDRDREHAMVEDTDWMRELGEAYDADGVNATELDESDMPPDWEPSLFTRRMDGFLMVADMLHPLVAEDDDANCIVMGADELHLKPMVEGVLDRSSTAGSLHALYTRLVPGFDGYPKLSRRIPASRFTLEADLDEIRRRIRDAPGGDTLDAPTDSVVFEAMRLASAVDADQLDTWRRAFTAGGDAWTDATAAFADELVEYANLWQKTADEN